MSAAFNHWRRVGILGSILSTALIAACSGGGASTNPVAAPTILTQPQSVTVIDGQPATFSVTAAGTAPLAYQWMRNGQQIANAQDTNYTVPSAQYGDSGTQYSVTVYNTAGPVSSTPATLTVTAVRPSITTQPSAQSVMVGASATFQVVAAGTTPLSYQWNKNGVAIPGATSPTYIDQGAQLADNSAQFTVTITNVAGTITSNAVGLTVQAPAPTIVTQPQQQTVVAGATATFSVLASGTPPLSFQWMQNGVAITGANSASYVTPPTSAANSGETFDVVVTNASGSVTSASVMLTVDVATVAPTITTQPQATTAAIGASAVFTVAASGTQPLTYQWQVGGVAIAGATNSTYTLAPVAGQYNNDSYTVVVTNTAGSVTSQPAALTVTVPAGRIDLVAGQLGGAGNLDASASISRFYQPETLATDAAGDVFVADTYNSDIREITVAGQVIPVAGSHDDPGSIDGVGTSALFNYPQGIALDASGNIYVADTGNQTIRRISTSGVVSTIAGTAGMTGSTDGSGATALFGYPQGLATDAAGNLYVADTANNTIREVTPAGVVSTIAGTAGVTGSNDGTGPAAQFYAPQAVAVDASGNIYVADTGNDTIRVIAPGGVVTTLAGSPGQANWADGTGAAARFDHPRGLAIDLSGNLFVADNYSGTIRELTPAGVVTTVAGSPYASGFTDGAGSAARFSGPWGLAVDAADSIYVADFSNDTVRKITAGANVTTLAGTAPHPGSVDGTGSAAQFNAPQVAATDSSGKIYVADTANNTIRVITPAGVVSTLAGTAGTTGAANGTGAAAQFNAPKGIATDSTANVYVADTANNLIRKITPAGVVTTLAGTAGATGSTDGTGTAALFNAPQGLVCDASGNLYVADTGNDTIRKITPGGVVTTLAGTAGTAGAADGTGNAATFSAPQALTIDSSGNLYVADTGNYTLRVVSPTGVVTTLAGAAGQAGFADGTGVDARFNIPTGITIDSKGNLYVLDSFYHIVREVALNGAVSTIAGVPSFRGVELGALPGAFNNPLGITILPGATVTLVVPDQGENAILTVTLP